MSGACMRCEGVPDVVRLAACRMRRSCKGFGAAATARRCRRSCARTARTRCRALLSRSLRRSRPYPPIPAHYPPITRPYPLASSQMRSAHRSAAAATGGARLGCPRVGVRLLCAHACRCMLGRVRACSRMLVRACARACQCVSVFVCVRVSVRTRACVCMRVHVRARVACACVRACGSPCARAGQATQRRRAGSARSRHRALCRLHRRQL